MGGRFVADETGLKDRYDFELMAGWETGGDPAEGVQPRVVNPDAASVFTAPPEQLGLKLEPRRTAVSFFIDRLRAPTENE
ncbi:MAG TPA: TIGR03435 family protein [Bryobacteraceae bacterium]|nr:TIGR03435 family protein [Bryobacteraceae bacterium]